MIERESENHRGGSTGLSVYIKSFPQNEPFLIVSGGCVCFVSADLPECMQMVP